jgi:hypothetical protein
VYLHFPGGNHRVSDKESCRSEPSNRVKPYLIVHALFIFALRTASHVDFLRHLLFEFFNWLEEVAELLHASEDFVGTEF